MSSAALEAHLSGKLPIHFLADTTTVTLAMEQLWHEVSAQVFLVAGCHSTQRRPAPSQIVAAIINADASTSSHPFPVAFGQRSMCVGS